MSLLSVLAGVYSPFRSAPVLELRDSYNESLATPHNYTAIDTETSGLDARSCEILELAAIRYRDHTPVDEFHTFVCPVGRIPKAASAVNHITLSKVILAPPSQIALADFFAFLGDDTLLGYNIGFDMKFIQTRAQRDLPNPAFDVLPFARHLLPGHRNYKLDTLRRDLSLGGRAHTALGDCKATANLYQHCFESDQYKKYMLLIQKAQEKSSHRR